MKPIQEANHRVDRTAPKVAVGHTARSRHNWNMNARQREQVLWPHKALWQFYILAWTSPLALVPIEADLLAREPAIWFARVWGYAGFIIGWIPWFRKQVDFPSSIFLVGIVPLIFMFCLRIILSKAGFGISL